MAVKRVVPDNHAITCTSLVNFYGPNAPYHSTNSVVVLLRIINNNNTCWMALCLGLPGESVPER